MMNGQELKNALERAGMTQAKLARLVKRTPRHVNRWVRGDLSIPDWIEVIMVLLSNRPELKMFFADRIAIAKVSRKKREKQDADRERA